ncbi:hypothetical protein [Streptomyces sp. bgisy100]|uniref:hypothetical protein n=1 Tax=Streptomyces sp. bgisy100 TaxID=3413783 RepID=UPI003D752910
MACRVPVDERPFMPDVAIWITDQLTLVDGRLPAAQPLFPVSSRTLHDTTAPCVGTFGGWWRPTGDHWRHRPPLLTPPPRAR